MRPDAVRASPAALRPLRVVAAGGGSGLPRVLAGLLPERAAPRGPGGAAPGRVDGVGAAGVARAPVHARGRTVEITAVVTTADDGGSSGVLRRAYGVPAPGDVRNCLVALAGAGSPWGALFQHRFEGGGPLAGHTVGNVVLTALTQRLGDFGLAVEAAARLVGARGRVLPAVEGEAALVAALSDGREVRGERALSRATGRVEALRLDRPAPAPRRALAAIREADLVVLGPGSLYSSVLASVLGEGMREALRATRAVRVLVVNLFTQPGETDGYAAADHVRALQRHLGDVVDVALCQRTPPPACSHGTAARRGGAPVRVDPAAVERLGTVAVRADVAAVDAVARHDPRKLAAALLAVARLREGVPC